MLRRNTILGISLLLAGVVGASAQERKPLSPPGTAAAMVGGKWAAPDKDGNREYERGKWIEVEYSRPMLRGRTDIFGTGADYGKMVTGGDKVWRAGANKTTRLKTEVPLVIGGKTLAPGEYSLFIDLKEGAWTLVVSSQAAQSKYSESEKTATWGSTNYDPKFDVVRVPMTMITPKASIDQFTIGFVDVTDTAGKLAFAWEKTAGVVPFTVGK